MSSISTLFVLSAPSEYVRGNHNSYMTKNDPQRHIHDHFMEIVGVPFIGCEPRQYRWNPGY